MPGQEEGSKIVTSFYTWVTETKFEAKTQRKRNECDLGLGIDFNGITNFIKAIVKHFFKFSC